MITLVTSWYDEQPDWLYEMVCSVAGVCDHVVAVDGAYSLFPGGQARSHPDQAAAISFAACQHGMGLTLHQPRAPWAGNECEKRNMLYALAAVIKPDWMLILDGDEHVLEVPDGLADHLDSSPHDVVAVEHYLLPEGQYGWCRKLYRPPLTVGDFHAQYLNPAGVDLASVEPCGMLEGFVVAHRKRERDPQRTEAAASYYRQRDTLGIEVQP